MARSSTLPDLLRDAARRAPEAEAFRYRDERLPYADWDALADHTVGALAARGVQRGDVVALLLPTTPLSLVAYLGAARLGAITNGGRRSATCSPARARAASVMRRSGAPATRRVM